MQLVLNIVGKDFLRLRWALLGAWAVTAAKFALGWWLLLGTTPELTAWKELPKVAVGLVGLEAVFTWLVTGLLVLEDGLVGAAAWRTRPIAGQQLLAAKGLGAFLFLVAPALVLGLPWWWFNGFGWAEMGPAALASVALQVAVIVPSLFVAVWVDTIARFVVWSLVGVAMLLTLPLVWVLALANRLPTGAEIGALLLMAAAGGPLLGVVVWRYGCAGRRALVGVTVAVTALTVAAGVSLIKQASSWGREAWVERNAAAVPDAKVMWRRAKVHDVPKGPVPYAQVFSWFTISGLPEHCSVMLAQSEHVWTWSDGMRVARQASGWTNSELTARMLGLTAAKPDEETERWRENERRKKMGGMSPFAVRSSLPPREVAGLTTQTTVAVPPSMAARLRKGEVDYTLEAFLRITQAAVLLDLPLREGVQAAAAGYRLRVSRVTEEGTLRVVRTVESRPALEEVALRDSDGWRRALRSPTVWAIDREKGRVDRVWGDVSPSVLIAGVSVEARRARVYPPTIVREGKWRVADPAWVERQRVTLVGWEEVARIKRGTQAKFSVSGERD